MDKWRQYPSSQQLLKKLREEDPRESVAFPTLTF
jgi:hypothetical protein